MWSEDRRKAEKAIIVLVALYHQARADRNHAVAIAYARAIRVVRRQFDPQNAMAPMLCKGRKKALASACVPDGIREGYRGDLRRAPVRSTIGC